MERKSIESRKDRLDKRGKRSKSTEKKQKVSDVNKTAAGPIASNHSKSEIHVGPRHFVKLSEKDSGTKTHADLKRERKLARRAERRAEKEVGDTTSASQ